MEKVFVDTSAWFAYMNVRDVDHVRVRDALRGWRGRLITSNFVFDETLTLLQARGGPVVALRIGESLRDPDFVQFVRVSQEDEDDAWDFFLKHRDKNYSFTDCTSFILMRRLDLRKALATDADFRRAGFRVDP